MDLRSEEHIAYFADTPSKRVEYRLPPLESDEWRSLLMWTLEACRCMLENQGPVITGFSWDPDENGTTLYHFLSESTTILGMLGVRTELLEPSTKGGREKIKWKVTFPTGKKQVLRLTFEGESQRLDTSGAPIFEMTTENVLTLTDEDRQVLSRCVSEWIDFGEANGFKKPDVEKVKGWIAQNRRNLQEMMDSYLRIKGRLQEEGPIPPNKFAFNGVEVDLQPQDWEAVNTLYDRPHRTMGYDDLAMLVWGDEEISKGPFDGVRRRVNKIFLDAKIPYQLGKKGPKLPWKSWREKASKKPLKIFAK